MEHQSEKFDFLSRFWPLTLCYELKRVCASFSSELFFLTLEKMNLPSSFDELLKISMIPGVSRGANTSIVPVFGVFLAVLTENFYKKDGKILVSIKAKYINNLRIIFK